MAHANQARQSHRAAVDQGHAKAATEHAKVGVCFHHTHVAPQRQLHTTGYGSAADRSNHRLGQLQARRTHRSERPRRHAVFGRKIECGERTRLIRRGLLRQSRTREQIPARAKMTMRAMEHGNARCLIGIESQKGCVQLTRRTGVHGIADFRTVQRYHGDRALLFNGN